MVNVQTSLYAIFSIIVAELIKRFGMPRIMVLIYIILQILINRTPKKQNSTT